MPGIKHGKLLKCPNSPNCVSTSELSTSKKYVRPLPFSHSAFALKDIIRSYFRDQTAYTKVHEGEFYFHYEFRSKIFKFVDDVELLISPEDQIIHIRSASRVGYWDLGANRRRVSHIRKDIQTKIAEL
ncbi:MAG: DUF1499 domain-containing protein [Bdellovibrionales bacterium]|nr:DUF1499 domain-containing protein [Bdellovibrionales bacterium]